MISAIIYNDCCVMITDETKKLPQSYLIEPERRDTVLREGRVMASSMKIVALFALFDCMFIFVTIIGGCSDDGDCSSDSEWVCCGTGSSFDGVCRLESCFNQFCRTDNECANDKDRLICCGNRCVFGSNCASRSCSMDSDCSANQACCHSKCSRRISCLVKDALSTQIVPLIKHVVIQNALKGTTASDNVVILTPTVPVVNLAVVASARMV